MVTKSEHPIMSILLFLSKNFFGLRQLLKLALCRETLLCVNFPSVLCSKQRCRDSLKCKRKTLGRSDHRKKKIIYRPYQFSGRFPLFLMCLKKVLIPPARCFSKFYVDGNNLNYIYGVFAVSPFGHVFGF